jgi:hypothetical protein
MLSRETPNTAAPALTKSLYLSRNCIASVVQPGGVVLGVKVEDENLAVVGRIGNLDPAGRIGFKFREGFVDNDRHMSSFSLGEVVESPVGVRLVLLVGRHRQQPAILP